MALETSRTLVVSFIIYGPTLSFISQKRLQVKPRFDDTALAACPRGCTDLGM